MVDTAEIEMESLKTFGSPKLRAGRREGRAWTHREREGLRRDLCKVVQGCMHYDRWIHAAE